mmetsp:Transcript_130520/g.226832  ORF Transcript_130520/g.226832 Transcript_130520/m.226832 type:complete len:409 (+) Transcript_130520:63-1289(+)
MLIITEPHEATAEAVKGIIEIATDANQLYNLSDEHGTVLSRYPEVRSLLLGKLQLLSLQRLVASQKIMWRKVILSVLFLPGWHFLFPAQCHSFFAFNPWKPTVFDAPPFTHFCWLLAMAWLSAMACLLVSHWLLLTLLRWALKVKTKDGQGAEMDPGLLKRRLELAGATPPDGQYTAKAMLISVSAGVVEELSFRWLFVLSNIMFLKMLEFIEPSVFWSVPIVFLLRVATRADVSQGYKQGRMQGGSGFYAERRRRCGCAMCAILVIVLQIGYWNIWGAPALVQTLLQCYLRALNWATFGYMDFLWGKSPSLNPDLAAGFAIAVGRFALNHIDRGITMLPYFFWSSNLFLYCTLTHGIQYAMLLHVVYDAMCSLIMPFCKRFGIRTIQSRIFKEKAFQEGPDTSLQLM